MPKFHVHNVIFYEKLKKGEKEPRERSFNRKYLTVSGRNEMNTYVNLYNNTGCVLSAQSNEEDFWYISTKEALELASVWDEIVAVAPEESLEDIKKIREDWLEYAVKANLTGEQVHFLGSTVIPKLGEMIRTVFYDVDLYFTLHDLPDDFRMQYMRYGTNELYIFCEEEKRMYHLMVAMLQNASDHKDERNCDLIIGLLEKFKNLGVFDECVRQGKIELLEKLGVYVNQGIQIRLPKKTLSDKAFNFFHDYIKFQLAPHCHCYTKQTERAQFPYFD